MPAPMPEKSSVEFYPVEEMVKCAKISAVTDDAVSYTVLAPVAASFDVGRHVYLTLFRSAVEEGRIKLADLPEDGILGALRLLGELIEENRQLRSTLSRVKGSANELVSYAEDLVLAHGRAEDHAGEVATRAETARTELDGVYTAVCNVTDTVDELRELLDVGDGA